MYEFEDILEELGSFGPFQVIVFLLVSAFEAPAAWAMLLHVFAAARPTWVCPGQMDVGNSSIEEYLMSNTTENHSELCTPEGFVCPGRIYTSDFTSIVTEWDLVCSSSYISTLIITLHMTGVLVGACITGQLADTWGRRHVLFIVYTLLLVSNFMTAFATSWQLYAACKFFVGAFFGGTLLVNFVLPLEFVGRRWRTFCGCIGFWAAGVMTLALMAFLLRDWRHLSWAASALGTPLLLTWWFIPESPRWLIQKGRVEEAAKILQRIAKFNKKPMPDISRLESFALREDQLRAEQKRHSYIDLFRSCTMAKHTVILMFAWFVSSSVYYGTSLNMSSLSGDRYINFFLSGLVEIPPLFLVVLVNNRCGRLKTLCSLMLLAGASMIAILFVDLTGALEKLPPLTLTLALAGRAGIAGGWAAAQILSAEVFPTVVRNIGVGACSMSSRVGGIIAPQIVALSSRSFLLPYLIFGGLGITCGLLTFLLPETVHRPLPEQLPARQCQKRSSTEFTALKTIVSNGGTLEHEESTALRTQSPKAGNTGPPQADFSVVSV